MLVPFRIKGLISACIFFTRKRTKFSFHSLCRDFLLPILTAKPIWFTSLSMDYQWLFYSSLTSKRKKQLSGFLLFLFLKRKCVFADSLYIGLLRHIINNALYALRLDTKKLLLKNTHYSITEILWCALNTFKIPQCKILK